jgi:type IV pilus assembly protein PilB
LDWARREKLGEILLAEGVITVLDLQRALRMQKDTGGKLGEILVSLGVLDEDRLIRYLGEQLGMRSLQLERFFVPCEILSLLPERTLQECGIMPLFLEERKLHLAMVDPLDTETIERVERETGLSVEPCISSPGGMSRCVSINLTGADWSSGKKEEETFVSGGRIMRDLLTEMMRGGLSELVLDASAQGVRVRAGRGGDMTKLEGDSVRLDRGAIELLASFLGLSRSEGTSMRETICRLEMGDRAFSVRANWMETLQGENLALRFVMRNLYLHGLPGTGMSQALSERCRVLMQRKGGVVVVTSPPGQGKTVTLYAMLKEISDREKSVYLTEESPLDALDFLHQVKAADAGKNGTDLALRSLAKHTPEVVGVDECREPDLLKSILHGISRRTLVLLTLEARNFSDAWERMLSMSRDPHLLASSLQGVVSQKFISGSTPWFQVIEVTPSLRTVVENCDNFSTLNCVLEENGLISTCDFEGSR